MWAWGVELAKVRSWGRLVNRLGIARFQLGANIRAQHCILTPQSVIPPGEVVPDFTVIYSNGTRRMDKRGVIDLKNKAQARQIEVLRKLIPSNPAKFQP